MNTIAGKISSTLQAIENCRKAGNTVWEQRHEETLREIIENLPSGAGIDCGTKLDCRSTSKRLVFVADYHHMNDNGMYDGWTTHKIIVTPSFQGIYIKITGRDRNGIKDYLFDVYHEALSNQYSE